MTPTATPHLTRRRFLQLTALASAAGCAVSMPTAAFAASATGMLLGVQLYMFRKEAAQDLAAVFKSIHDVGFTELELFPIAYTHSATDLRAMIHDAGLRCPAAHVDYNGLDGKIDYIHDIGCEYLICPSLPGDLGSTLDGFRKAGANFNTWGKQVKDRGMTFAFHNHNREFRPIDGSTGFAELMNHTDPALVKLEFDCYWLAQAGQDPLAMMKQYADRLRILHLKDRSTGANSFTGEPQLFADLGKGTLDWPAIFAQAKRQNIRYAFMDQDQTPNSTPLDSLKASYTYLKSIHA